MKRTTHLKLLAAAIAVAGAGPAAAFTFDLENGISGNFDTSLSLGMGVRVKNPGCNQIIGSVGGGASPATPAGKAPAGCLDGLSFVNDQGNLNYKRGDAFTTYLKGNHELLLKFPDSWKFFTRVNWVKDFTATRDSGYVSGGNQPGMASGSHYPGGADKDLSFKARLLDFWVSKEFDLGGQQARVRVGNQVISWGESLFLPGGINQTNPMDIMRLSQPGTQLKEVFLPSPIASFATGLGHGFNVEAYVQAGWNQNYFPPLGSYWNTGTIGLGSDRYGMWSAETHGMTKGGQFGAALKYQPIGTEMNFGLYAMRYHDKAPSFSYADPANALGAQFKYLPDRTLFGVSTNFPLGDWAIGAELSYRPKDAVSLNPLAFNTVDGGGCLAGGNCYKDEKKFQFALTGILAMSPSDYGGILNLLGGADTATFLGEFVAMRYPGLKKTYQGVPVAAGYWGWGALTTAEAANYIGPGSNLPSAGTKTSMGYNFDFSWTYDGKIIPGWQVTPEIYFFHAIKGRSPNAMALFMEGAKSMNFAVTFLQNASRWAVGVNYAKFWGGKNVLDQPLKNRDFVGGYITRNF